MLVDFDRVIFRADRDLDEKYELFVATAGVHGSPQVPAQLHEELFVSSVADVYKLSPDGQRVAFVRLEDIINDIDQELRSSEVLAPGSSTLLATVPSPGIFERIEVAFSPPSDHRVVFRADRDEVDRVELYSVPFAGGAVVRLNPTSNTLLTTWDVHDFEVAGDGRHVSFVYESEVILSGARTLQLRSSPSAGGGSFAVGPTLDPATHDGFLALEAPGASQFSPLLDHWTVSVHDAETAGVRRITLSDHCLFCDSFLGELARWELNP
jgi:hypothetical protein